MKRIDRSWDAFYDRLRLCIQRISQDPLNYLELYGLTQAVSDLVFFDDHLDSDDGLVHYTSWGNTLKMFGINQDTPVIRMYNYEQANDPEEGMIKPPEWEALEDKAMNQLLEVDESLKDQIGTFGAFGCSFSSGPRNGVEDDMTYWRLYGNDGQGCSLRISAFPSKGLYKVRYRHRDFRDRCDLEKIEDQQVANRLGKFVDLAKKAVDCTPKKYRCHAAKLIANVLFRVFYGYYYLVKHAAYEGEQEWRIIKVMPSKEEVRYDTDSANLVKRYVNGPALSELLISKSAITVGPTIANSGAALAFLKERVNETHKIGLVDVRTSKQKYRIKSTAIVK